MASAIQHTAAPTRHVVLYDGHCRFCTEQSQRLVRLARPGALEAVSFQEPGVLERFPGVTHEACMQAMHLVTPSGQVYRGFEAAVRAVATRPVLGWIAYGYYLPGIRQLCNWLYAWIASNRYRLMGKTNAADGCETGTCALHRH